jgi:hypothetical protein
MNLKTPILMAALSLIMRAVTAQSADIPITALPVNITTPGTYVVTANLSYPAYAPAIVIANNVAGKVVVDLNEFTLTGAGETDYSHVSFGVSIGYYQAPGTNTYPIIIRNGTLKNFTVGIDAGQGGRGVLTNLTVNNLKITHPASAPIQVTAVGFLCSFSIVSNYRISDYEYGISETTNGAGNNSFTNNTFTNVSSLSWSVTRLALARPLKW